MPVAGNSRAKVVLASSARAAGRGRDRYAPGGSPWLAGSAQHLCENVTRRNSRRIAWPLVLHTAAFSLMHGVRVAIPKTNQSPLASSLRSESARSRSARVTEHPARIRVQLPTSCPKGHCCEPQHSARSYPAHESRGLQHVEPPIQAAVDLNDPIGPIVDMRTPTSRGKTAQRCMNAGWRRRGCDGGRYFTSRVLEGCMALRVVGRREGIGLLRREGRPNGNPSLTGRKAGSRYSGAFIGEV
jgi:hypothetical protein